MFYFNTLLHVFSDSIKCPARAAAGWDTSHHLAPHSDTHTTTARMGGPGRDSKKALDCAAQARCKLQRGPNTHGPHSSTHGKVPSTTAIHAHFDIGPTPVLLLILGPAWLGPPRSRSQLGWGRVSSHVDPMIPKKEKTHDHRRLSLCGAYLFGTASR